MSGDGYKYNGILALPQKQPQYDDFSSLMLPKHDTSSPVTKSLVYNTNKDYDYTGVGNGSNGLLGTGANSDYINSNLQASTWNQNLGTVSGIANLANMTLNYGNQKKIAKNNIALQGQQIALNDANLKNLQGFRKNLADATTKVMG